MYYAFIVRILFFINSFLLQFDQNFFLLLKIDLLIVFQFVRLVIKPIYATVRFSLKFCKLRCCHMIYQQDMISVRAVTTLSNSKKYILHHIFPRGTHLNKTSLTFTVSGFPSLSVYTTSSLTHLG